MQTQLCDVLSMQCTAAACYSIIEMKILNCGLNTYVCSEMYMLFSRFLISISAELENVKSVVFLNLQNLCSNIMIRFTRCINDFLRNTHHKIISLLQGTIHPYNHNTHT